jgi:hypothetical protein
MDKIKHNFNAFYKLCTHQAQIYCVFLRKINDRLSLMESQAKFNTYDNCIQINILDIKVELVMCGWSFDANVLINVYKLDIYKNGILKINNVVECICDYLPFNQDVCIRLIDKSIYTFDRTNIVLSHLSLLAENKSLYMEKGFLPAGDDGYPSQQKYIQICESVKKYKENGKSDDELREFNEKAARIFDNVKTCKNKVISNSTEKRHIKEADLFLQEHKNFLYTTYSRFLSKWAVIQNPIRQTQDAKKLVKDIVDDLDSKLRYRGTLIRLHPIIVILIGKYNGCVELSVEIKGKDVEIVLSNIVNSLAEGGEYTVDRDRYTGKMLMQEIDEVTKCICKHIPFDRYIYMSLADTSNLVFPFNRKYSINLATIRLLTTGKSWFNSYGFIASGEDGRPDEVKQRSIQDSISNYRQQMYKNTGMTIANMAIQKYNSIKHFNTHIAMPPENQDLLEERRDLLKKLRDEEIELIEDDQDLLEERRDLLKKLRDEIELIEDDQYLLEERRDLLKKLRDEEIELIEDVTSFFEEEEGDICQLYDRNLSKLIRRAEVFAPAQHFKQRINEYLSSHLNCSVFFEPTLHININHEIHGTTYASIDVKNWDRNEIVVFEMDIIESSFQDLKNKNISFDHLMKNILKIIYTIYNDLPFVQYAYVYTKSSLVFTDTNALSMPVSFLKLLATNKNMYSKYGFVAMNSDMRPDYSIEEEITTTVIDYKMARPGLGEDAARIYDNMIGILPDKAFERAKGYHHTGGIIPANISSFFAFERDNVAEARKLVDLHYNSLETALKRVPYVGMWID